MKIVWQHATDFEDAIFPFVHNILSSKQCSLVRSHQVNSIRIHIIENSVYANGATNDIITVKSKCHLRKSLNALNCSIKSMKRSWSFWLRIRLKRKRRNHNVGATDDVIIRNWRSRLLLSFRFVFFFSFFSLEFFRPKALFMAKESREKHIVQNDKVLFFFTLYYYFTHRNNSFKTELLM